MKKALIFLGIALALMLLAACAGAPAGTNMPVTEVTSMPTPPAQLTAPVATDQAIEPYPGPAVQCPAPNPGQWIWINATDKMMAQPSSAGAFEFTFVYYDDGRDKESTGWAIYSFYLDGLLEEDDTNEAQFTPYPEDGTSYHFTLDDVDLGTFIPASSEFDWDCISMKEAPPPAIIPTPRPTPVSNGPQG